MRLLERTPRHVSLTGDGTLPGVLVLAARREPGCASALAAAFR